VVDSEQHDVVRVLLRHGDVELAAARLLHRGLTVLLDGGHVLVHLGRHDIELDQVDEQRARLRGSLLAGHRQQHPGRGGKRDGNSTQRNRLEHGSLLPWSNDVLIWCLKIPRIRRGTATRGGPACYIKRGAITAALRRPRSAASSICRRSRAVPCIPPNSAAP